MLLFLLSFAFFAWLLDVPAAHRALVAGIRADNRRRRV
jgi:hypothetical protein